MARVTDNENDEIADLERMARRAPSGDSGGDLNSPMFVDGKEGVAVGAFFPPGKYALRVIDLLLKQSKGGFDEKTQMNKESIPYLELTFICLGGETPQMVGEQITDRLMCKGKGVTRFKVFAKAVGLWNDDTDTCSARPIDFLETEVWATIKTEKSTYNNQERERSIIDFAGFEPIDKYPLVDDGIFADEDEEETSTSVPATADDVPAEDEDDEDMTAGIPEEPETEDEVEEEIETVAAPVAPPTRPRARAAGQAGAQPPWK